MSVCMLISRGIQEQSSMENYHVLDLHVNLLIGEQQFRGDLCDEADRFSIRKRTLAIFHLIFTSRRVFREIYLVDAQHVFDSL